MDLRRNKMTNADRVRTMTNKQLFSYLNERGFCPYIGECARGDQNCKKCLKNYLEREVKK